MRYYELLYIVNPNLEDDRVNNIIDEIGNEINKYKVSIINHYIWGKKRLAYPVKNNKYGIYILLQFSAEQFDFLIEFERFLVLDKTVIRHQIVKLDKEPEKVENIEPVVDKTDSLKDESFKIPDDDSKIEQEDSEKVEIVEKTEVVEKAGKVKEKEIVEKTEEIDNVDTIDVEESKDIKEIKVEKNKENK